MNIQDLIGHTVISKLDLYHTQSEISVIRNQNSVKNLSCENIESKLTP